jgi:hypothetical protein
MPGSMSPTDITARLASFSGRGAGTDAERRAALWLASELRPAARAPNRREVGLEPFWCRPNWALAHGWHVALGIAGSLIAVSAPRVGGVLLLVALLSVIADEVFGVSLGRRLTPERASQNVIATSASKARIRLIITANYDAGRTGLWFRDRLRGTRAWLRRVGAPGWLGWVVLALVWLLVVAVLRIQGHKGTGIGIAQVLPTAGLVVALALLVEQGSAGFGPGANDNASGVAVAIALARALDAAPPARLGVDIVLQGAADQGGIGLRKFLRARRGSVDATTAVVLGVAASGAGQPRWWVSDGALIPLRYFSGLGRLCEGVASAEGHLGAAGHRGRGYTPALRARIARLPAISVGALDPRGRTPRSHQAADTADAIDPGALDATVQFGLLLVDAIDAFVATVPALAASANGNELRRGRLRRA